MNPELMYFQKLKIPKSGQILKNQMKIPKSGFLLNTCLGFDIF